MFRRSVQTAIGVVAAALLAVPASAQVVQGFQVGVGGFFPKGYDGRAANDVLVTDLNTLDFDLRNFNSGQVFGEYDLDFGRHIEVGAGVGYYRSTVPSIYANLVNQDGSDITQNLRLRIIPISAVVRFMPVGKPGHVQPYVGAGVEALVWRYSEFGNFVDDNNNVFQASFVGSGTSPAGVVLGGIKIPARGDIFALTLEGRYQFGMGTLDTTQFLSNKIDLGGGSFTVGFQVRY